MAPLRNRGMFILASGAHYTFISKSLHFCDFCLLTFSCSAEPENMQNWDLRAWFAIGIPTFGRGSSACFLQRNYWTNGPLVQIGTLKRKVMGLLLVTDCHLGKPKNAISNCKYAHCKLKAAIMMQNIDMRKEFILAFPIKVQVAICSRMSRTLPVL